jgi:PIN domain nuclease of toxin-antitoxin system
MKSYLLDTCALLWWMSDAAELGRTARRVIGNRRNQIYVSAASLWEIAIKRRRGRLDGVDDYLTRYEEWHATWGFAPVSIEPADAVAAGLLPIPHDDPFDRLLIVQGRRLEAPVVTCDEAVRRYAAASLW